MGRVKKFDIFLDNPSAVYFAGQMITGQVVLILSAPLEHKAIYLQFLGKGEVLWEERTSSSDPSFQQTDSTTYSASEVYLNYQINLAESTPRNFPGGRTTLGAGEHTFVFTYQLPTNLPSSFEGTFGHVRYFCRSVIDRPWKFDTVSKRLFTVNALVDLNLESTAMNSATNQNHKRLCCLCCRSGPISAMASISRIGYVPGEAIHISGEVTNLTRRKVDRSTAVLEAVIKYRTTLREKWETKEISHVQRGPIGPGESDIWDSVPLPIPPIPPSRLNGCKIIDIQYNLRFIVAPSGLALNLAISLPIIIGTIPLREYFDHYQSRPPDYDEAVRYSPTAPPLPQYPDLPPPSYAESVFGVIDGREKEDNEYVFGDLFYTPSYTFYNVH